MWKVLVVLVLAAALAACGPKPTASDGKVAVVANFYPIAFAAQQVGGDLVSVRNLTPAGVEPHDLELASDDVDHIESAKVVFYMGSGFQPAVASAAKRRPHNTVDVSAGLLSSKSDPHFWLDPTLMSKAVDKLQTGLDASDPAHTSTYEKNANAYKRRLGQLDAEYRAGLAHCARTEIVTAHAAFGYLAQEYGLKQEAVTGVSPEAEPSPARIADLAALIRRDRITTVFFEELVPRDFADTLAREANVKTAVLSPLEGLTKQEQADGATYLTVMQRNLVALQKALGC